MTGLDSKFKEKGSTRKLMLDITRMDTTSAYIFFKRLAVNSLKATVSTYKLEVYFQPNDGLVGNIFGD